MSLLPANILYSSLSGEMIGGGQNSLLLLLERMDRTRFRPFLVCPTPGELIDRANAMGIETLVIPMPPLRSFLPFSGLFVTREKTLNTEHRTSNVERNRTSSLRCSKLDVQCSMFSFFPYRSLFSLARFIKTHNIHLIHTDTPRQAFYLGLAGILCRRPMIWHIRTSERQNRLFDRLLFALSRRVIPVSHAAARRFHHLPGQDKIRIVHNGIDVAGYAPNEASRRVRAEFAPGGELLIGTAGQLVPEKGIETFLEAAALALSHTSAFPKTNEALSVGRPPEADTLPAFAASGHYGGDTRVSRPNSPVVPAEKPVRFLVIGRGTDDYVAFLKKKAVDLGIGDSVIFTGFRRDMPQIMAALDIFVLATKAAEGLSRSILEAMACAVPVVATNIGGNPELVVDRETGILVPADNAQAMASEIVKLIGTEGQRRPMGTRGRVRVKTDFNLTSNVGSVERIYEELL